METTDTTIRKIKEIIIQELQCPDDFMENKKRTRGEYAYPRQVMMYVIKNNLPNVTLDKMKLYFGAIKSHATKT